MAEKALWRIKNGDTTSAPKTLAHFSSPFLSQSSERQSAVESSQQTRCGDGGSAIAPLAGARVRPEPRAAPSSGTTVVPFGPSLRRRSRRALKLEGRCLGRSRRPTAAAARRAACGCVSGSVLEGSNRPLGLYRYPHGLTLTLTVYCARHSAQRRHRTH